MKSSTKKIILWSAVIVLLLAAVIVLCWYHSPGVHVLGPFARVDLDERCYIMDLDTGEVLEKSWLAVRVDGNLWTKTASGVARVDEYPVTGDATLSISKKNALKLSYTGILFTPSDGDTASQTELSAYYTLWHAKDVTGVLLGNFDAQASEPVKVAICALSAEEAANKLQQWKTLVYTPEI